MAIMLGSGIIPATLRKVCYITQNQLRNTCEYYLFNCMFKNENMVLPNKQLKTTKFRVKTQRSYSKLQQKPYKSVLL